MGTSSDSDASNKSAAAPSPGAEAGTILAHRYEVVRELGRGGMGVVYLCKDIVIGDRVALKRLRSPEEKGEQRPEESWWFHQEARAVAAPRPPRRSCAPATSASSPTARRSS